MRKTIGILLLMSFILFALAYLSYTVGVEYDEKNKLYREINWVSEDLAIGHIYGKRWERIGNTLFLFGSLIGIVASVIWYRGEQSEDKSILNLAKEK